MWEASLRRKAIDKLVTHLLEKNGIKTPPVDVEKIAQLLNIEIRKRPYDGNGGLSGVLIRDKSSVILGVNSKHHEHRQRFSIAHELGHFLLHEGEQVFVDREYKINYRDGKSSLGIHIKEVEANRFASLLLIPEEFLVKDLAKYEVDLFDSKELQKLAKTLAAKYNVSPTSMMLRLSSLN